MKVKEAPLISDGEARSVMWNDQKRPHYVNGSIIRDRHLLILLIRCSSDPYDRVRMSSTVDTRVVSPVFGGSYVSFRAWTCYVFEQVEETFHMSTYDKSRRSTFFLLDSSYFFVIPITTNY